MCLIHTIMFYEELFTSLLWQPEPLNRYPLTKNANITRLKSFYIEGGFVHVKNVS